MDIYSEWQITPQPSPPSVVDHVSSKPPDRTISQNGPSLPICDIVFIVYRHLVQQGGSVPHKVCGKLVLLGPLETQGLSKSSSHTIFKFNHPLTKNTQSASVSLSSSKYVSATVACCRFSNPWLDCSVICGYVVRILLVVGPMSERRTINLPVDVLPSIFENLYTLPAYRSWRRDILSCALVCRQWTCALNMLLADFRSEDSQQGRYPPEIASFADALLRQPNLGPGIKYLSTNYFVGHSAWLCHLRPSEHKGHCLSFSKAFLSILRVAKNTQFLTLALGKHALVFTPERFADTLRELDKLQTFKSVLWTPLSMAQLMPCLAAWPSLKRLIIKGALPPSDRSPLASLSCRLTEIELAHIPIRDDELTCLVSASGSTLARLRLDYVSQLTNTGLGVALDTVCTSLVELRVWSGAITHAEGEEHALDATIARMTRLTRLGISPQVASERMLQRRADAFEQRASLGLPVVHLDLMIGRGSEGSGLGGK